jgi:hypothetical protein
MSQPLEVANREGLVDPFEPPVVADRLLSPPQKGVPALPTGETGPLPVLGPRDQLCPQGVALDVPKHRDQMIIVLDGERLETPLPHVPRRAVMEMIAPGVRREQPLHLAPEVAIQRGPE